MIDKLWVLAGHVDVAKKRLTSLATSAVSLMMVLAVVAQTFADQIGVDWPDGARVAAKAAAVLLAAVFAVRRVTPVAKQDRGLRS